MRRAIAACLSLTLASAAPPFGAAAAIDARALKPPIVTREEWGSKPGPIPASRRQTPAWVTIHHAGVLWRGGDPADFVRKMQLWGQNRPTIEKPPFDTYWPDLPYHYLIAPDGRIFEGRPVEYEPESNTQYALSGNIGVELMGDFNLQRPSIAQLRSAAKLVAWLSAAHGIALARVRTHQDAAPGQTNCPGKDFRRYMNDGRFLFWVGEARDGMEPAVAPGPPLPDGPTAPIIVP